PHQTKHSDIANVLAIDPDTPGPDRVKHVSNDDAKNWNLAFDHSGVKGSNPHQVTAEQVGALSNEGGAVTGSLYVKTTDWSAISGTATKTHGVMGQLTEDIETGPTYRCAGVVGVSEIEGKHGVYAKAPQNTYALYVRGAAHFTGGASGCRLNTFINASGEALNTGDIVRLEGTPVTQFIGEDNEIPLAKVTFADEANAGLTMGIVHRKAMPLGDVPGTGTGTDDPSTIADGEELFVVTHGCYAKCQCKVDSPGEEINVGDLLTPSATPGYAKKAVEPKIGSMIGKALESFSGGEGEDPYIAVFVNIQ
ncbi:MAG: hypothetical protein GTO45_32030, partial [Candidatus Aminicenantes bacterium]|nr:hypothetical protein [Candidatus Aminicenantes bacterium]NIM83378.1 hypothetical protein [Candidatus Aminicenantes bacterium]NIN22770.1 hypothetical protein [Candidatus Aminicenantes bacterium]NIN46504.1 hypothetical protein [Candidatus Aminicenantes bacterium]NIN89409.1 hypothetical protein [Candidatus Aminicenantes bacterium]